MSTESVRYSFILHRVTLIKLCLINIRVMYIITSLSRIRVETHERLIRSSYYFFFFFFRFINNCENVLKDKKVTRVKRKGKNDFFFTFSFSFFCARTWIKKKKNDFPNVTGIIYCSTSINNCLQCEDVRVCRTVD